jgi:uncharacterized protein (DUF952 family)
MPEALLYKVCRAGDWADAATSGVYRGSAADLRDGFIHFSTKVQLAETLRRHFAGQQDLVLVEVASDALGPALRWEPSRGGALFPHLYGELPVSLAREVSAVEAPPSRKAMDQMVAALRPFRWLTSPVLTGLERIPAERPLLFVGNHTLFGVLDSPILISELYRLAGIVLRPLGDDLHFKVPGWAWASRRIGAVPASPETCARLMRAGETILVFPGGAREVAKRKGEKYKVVWGERTGFARLAIQHACTIVPFCSIGVEDAFDVVVDAEELTASPLGRALERLGIQRDRIMPLVKGIGPTPLPRPERFYFRFEAPIETASYEGRWDDAASCADLRDRVKASIEHSIEQSLAERERDPGRRLGARLSAWWRSRG